MAQYSLETTNANGAKNLKEEEEEDEFAIANNISSSMVFPLAVQTAVDLGIFDILAKGGEDVKLSAKEIATEIGSKNPEAPFMLDRILRLLASHSVLYCSLSKDDQRLYSLTPVSKYFVADADGVSLAPFLNPTWGKFILESWKGLKGAIFEGGTPFQRVYGKSLYEYAGCDPKFNDAFNKAMVNSSITLMKKIVEVYDGFENINKLVDVGGGHGINLNLITSKYSHIHGVNFDLPHVIEHAPSYAGVTHVGGDMFESVPSGDAIFMKSVLHNWDDEQCLKLLKNCYKAIPSEGTIIVVDSVLTVLPENTTIGKQDSQLDIIMMTFLPGGKERTKNDFIKLALESGFSGIKFVCSVSGSWVMEFLK